jgi:predicted nucleic acid-binding protein
VTDKVLDASAVAAMVFLEPTASAVTARVRGHVWIAPPLLKYEMANVCMKKLRVGSAASDTILGQFDAWQHIPVRLVEVNFPEAVRLAQRFKLSGYDACYLWLAKSLGCELITLDGRLGDAAKIFLS